MESGVGFQNLFRVTGVHCKIETFGELWTDPSGCGGNACSSANQEIGQQEDLFIGALTLIIDLCTELLEAVEHTKLE